MGDDKPAAPPEKSTDGRKKGPKARPALKWHASEYLSRFL